MIFRPPHLTDIVGVAAKMRAADAAECRAAGHDDLLHVLEEGVEHSTMARAALIDDQVACIWGVRPAGTMLTPIGVPWMLGTDLVPQHRRLLLGYAGDAIKRMLALYPILINFVHCENAQAVRWLK